MSLAATVFFIGVAISACGGSSPVEPASPPGESARESSSPAPVSEVELRLDVSVTHRDLTLRWHHLEDSRCPIGVTCFWAGEAVVTLEVTRGEGEAVEQRLALRAGREPETVQVLDHELRLLAVEPQPKEGITPERGDYVARLEITEP